MFWNNSGMLCLCGRGIIPSSLLLLMFLLPANTLPIQLSQLVIMANPETHLLSPLSNSIPPPPPVCLPPEAQKTPYFASYGPTRLTVHTLCTSHYLDLTITFIICINVITMSLEHYSQPKVPLPGSPPPPHSLGVGHATRQGGVAVCYSAWI